jgi:hypothetical protein
MWGVVNVSTPRMGIKACVSATRNYI